MILANESSIFSATIQKIIDCGYMSHLLYFLFFFDLSASFDSDEIENLNATIVTNYFGRLTEEFIQEFIFNCLENISNIETSVYDPDSFSQLQYDNSILVFEVGEGSQESEDAGDVDNNDETDTNDGAEEPNTERDGDGIGVGAIIAIVIG